MMLLPMFGLYGMLPLFLLVLFRISGMMIGAPVFSTPALPMRMKVLMAVAITLAVFPIMIPYLPEQVSLAVLVVGLMGELALGIFIGFCLTVVFQGVLVAVQSVGHMSGMRLGSVFNPMFEATGTTVAQLYYLVAMVVFLGLRGDHALVRAVLDSFQTVPPLAFQMTDGLVDTLVNVMLIAFRLAIRIGGPVILALMLAFMTLGFVSRTIPQLHILSVGFPLKIAVGLAILSMAILSLESVLLDALEAGVEAIRYGLGLAGA